MEKSRTISEEIRSIEPIADKPRFGKLIAEVRNDLGNALENMDRKLIFMLSLLLFMLGCSASEIREEGAQPSVKIKHLKDGKMEPEQPLSEQAQKVVKTIQQIRALKADAKKIPDVEIDPRESTDLAEDLAHIDMGIEISEAEKAQLRKEVGLTK